MPHSPAISIADLALFVMGLVVGVPLGYAIGMIVRAYRLGRRPCGFCNGHGYFASAEQESKVRGAVLDESRAFKP